MHSSPVDVITKAAAGLGRAIAHGYAKRGAGLVLIARNPEALAAAKAECERLGDSAVFVPTDQGDSGFTAPGSGVRFSRLKVLVQTRYVAVVEGNPATVWVGGQWVGLG